MAAGYIRTLLALAIVLLCSTGVHAQQQALNSITIDNAKPGALKIDCDGRYTVQTGYAPLTAQVQIRATNILTNQTTVSYSGVLNADGTWKGTILLPPGTYNLQASFLAWVKPNKDTITDVNSNTKEGVTVPNP